MIVKKQIIKDFFNTALSTWLLLLVFELSRSGSVQRFVNLEYYFYFLLLVFLIKRLTAS